MVEVASAIDISPSNGVKTKALCVSYKSVTSAFCFLDNSKGRANGKPSKTSVKGLRKHLILQDLSLHSDQRTQLAKLPIADTAHHHQVLSTAKAAMLFSVGDDSLGKHRADSGKSFDLGGIRGVEI